MEELARLSRDDLLKLRHGHETGSRTGDSWADIERRYGGEAESDDDDDDDDDFLLHDLKSMVLEKPVMSATRAQSSDLTSNSSSAASTVVHTPALKDSEGTNRVIQEVNVKKTLEHDPELQSKINNRLKLSNIKSQTEQAQLSLESDLKVKDRLRISKFHYDFDDSDEDEKGNQVYHENSIAFDVDSTKEAFSNDTDTIDNTDTLPNDGKATENADESATPLWDHDTNEDQFKENNEQLDSDLDSDSDLEKFTDYSESMMPSPPSSPPRELDPAKLYALYDFNGPDPSHLELFKDDSVLLINDSDSYWWLVRKVDNNQVGFAPAEILETYSERLARLNCWKNEILERGGYDNLRFEDERKLFITNYPIDHTHGSSTNNDNEQGNENNNENDERLRRTDENNLKHNHSNNHKNNSNNSIHTSIPNTSTNSIENYQETSTEKEHMGYNGRSKTSSRVNMAIASESVISIDRIERKGSLKKPNSISTNKTVSFADINEFKEASDFESGGENDYCGNSSASIYDDVSSNNSSSSNLIDGYNQESTLPLSQDEHDNDQSENTEEISLDINSSGDEFGNHIPLMIPKSRKTKNFMIKNLEDYHYSSEGEETGDFSYDGEKLEGVQDKLQEEGAQEGVQDEVQDEVPEEEHAVLNASSDTATNRLDTEGNGPTKAKSNNVKSYGEQPLFIPKTRTAEKNPDSLGETRLGSLKMLDDLLDQYPEFVDSQSEDEASPTDEPEAENDSCGHKSRSHSAVESTSDLAPAISLGEGYRSSLDSSRKSVSPFSAETHAPSDISISQDHIHPTTAKIFTPLLERMQQLDALLDDLQ